MSSYAISEVQTSLSEELYTFTVFSKTKITDSVNLVFSKSSPAKPTSFVEPETKIWNGDNGICTIKASALKGFASLYILIANQDKSVTSTPVRIFLAPPAVQNYMLLDNNRLMLMLDKSDINYQVLSAANGEILIEHSRIVSTLNPPKTVAELSDWNLFDASKSADIIVSYFMKSENANVYGPSTELISISIAGPEITSLLFDGSDLNFTIADTAPGKLYQAEIFRNGLKLAVKDLESDGKLLKLSTLKLDKSESYEVRLRSYKVFNDFNVYSYPGNFAPVVFDTPVYASCEFGLDGATLTLTQSGLYMVNGVLHEEYPLKLTSDIKLAAVSKVNGISSGPSADIPIISPATYCYNNIANVFYKFAERPFSAEPVFDSIDLPSAFPGFEGKYFKVSAANQAYKLTIDAKVLIDAEQDIQDEYLKLLNLSENYDTFEMIKTAIWVNMPLRAEEQHLYAYRYKPDSGYVDLLPGMSLSVEYASYQNIPQNNGGNSYSDAPLSGYTGSGKADYAVILRGGKISFEPFIKNMVDSLGAFTVPSPEPMRTDNKLSGGAGVCDLLFQGMAAPFVRLVYPKQYIGRDEEGYLEYFNNICVIAAETLENLETATQNLRQRRAGITSCSYNFFRGRSVVTVKIQILINGHPFSVSLGSTVGDVMKEFNLSGAALSRQAAAKGYEKKLYPVFSDDIRSIPLLMGDSIEVK